MVVDMCKEELINELQKGDSVLIIYNKYCNKISLVLEVQKDKIIFKDSDGKFEFTKKYLLNSNIELEIIQED
jgi:transcription elongation factor